MASQKAGQFTTTGKLFLKSKAVKVTFKSISLGQLFADSINPKSIEILKNIPDAHFKVHLTKLLLINLN